MSIKILHTADWHLSGKLLGEIWKCLAHMLSYARDNRDDIDLVVIPGDLLDSKGAILDTDFVKLCFDLVQALAEIAPVAIITGTDSHEGKAIEPLRHIKARHNVHVTSSTPEQIFLKSGKLFSSEEFLKAGSLDPQPDAIISMIPPPSKEYFESADAENRKDVKQTDHDIAQAMSGLFASFGAAASAWGVPHVLLGHWNVTGSYVSETQILTGVDIEISTDQMMLANAQAICLGHIHKAQELRNDGFFSGSVTRLTKGEADSEKGFYIHEINNERRISSEFIKLPARKLIYHAFDRTISDTVEGFVLDLKDVFDAEVVCEIKVFTDQMHLIDKKGLEEQYIFAGAKTVEVIRRKIPRKNIRCKEISKKTTLPDKLMAKASLDGEVLSKSLLDKAGLLQVSISDDDLIEKALSCFN